MSLSSHVAYNIYILVNPKALKYPLYGHYLRTYKDNRICKKWLKLFDLNMLQLLHATCWMAKVQDQSSVSQPVVGPSLSNPKEQINYIKCLDRLHKCVIQRKVKKPVVKEEIAVIQLVNCTAANHFSASKPIKPFLPARAPKKFWHLGQFWNFAEDLKSICQGSQACNASLQLVEY